MRDRQRSEWMSTPNTITPVRVRLAHAKHVSTTSYDARDHPLPRMSSQDKLNIQNPVRPCELEDDLLEGRKQSRKHAFIPRYLDTINTVH